jgi:RND superfamily putative drug exporter
MTADFLAFAAADVIPLRQFGVGLTIAVLLDATIVRLVLLPAIMRIAGPRIWWMPEWLARRLPDLEPGQTDSASGLADTPAQRRPGAPAASLSRAEYIRWRQAT